MQKKADSLSLFEQREGEHIRRYLTTRLANPVVKPEKARRKRKGRAVKVTVKRSPRPIGKQPTAQPIPGLHSRATAVALKRERRLYNPALWSVGCVINPPRDDTRPSYQTLGLVNRFKDDSFKCRIFPDQLPIRKKNRRARQRKNRKLKRRLARVGV